MDAHLTLIGTLEESWCDSFTSEKGGLGLEDAKTVCPKLFLSPVFKSFLCYKYIVTGQDAAEVPLSCFLAEATLGLIGI